MQRAENAIGRVTETVLELRRITREISEEAGEQTKGIERINRAIGSIDAATRLNAGLVIDSTRSARTLEDQVAELSNIIAVMRLAGEGK